MKRRDILKTMALSTASMAAPESLFAGNKTLKKPNIIYILADDLGYGDLGCYGQKKIMTPNIDRMAAEGIRFTQHYAGCTVCAPSRSCLMTGQHTGHTRIRGNSGKVRKPVPLESEDITVAKLLKKAGYATGIGGKWGLGEAGSTGIPNRQGFDEWFGYLNQRNAHFYYPPFLWHNEEKVTLDGNRDGKKGSFSQDSITDFALDFIKRHKDRPFFLYCPFTIPHAELVAPEDSMAPYRGKFAEEPFKGKHYGDQKEPHTAFAAMVSRLDRDVGRILSLLRELNLDDNTIVMFTSDNGPHIEGGADPDFFGSRGPLRGIKRDLYEGGIRVPMIARWPGKIKQGSVSGHISAFWDFLPTCTDLAGIDTPVAIDGISMVPALQGQEKMQKKHEYLYWEFHERGSKQAVRMGDWKGVRFIDGDRLELYNLSNDIGEKNDIEKKRPDIARKIRELMSAARTSSEHWGLQ